MIMIANDRYSLGRGGVIHTDTITITPGNLAVKVKSTNGMKGLQKTHTGVVSPPT